MQASASAFPFAGWTATPDPLLWVAAAMVAAAVGGEAAVRLFGWPRVTGWFVTGLLFGSWSAFVDASSIATDLRLVVDLALAVLLFELGTRVDLRWLRANPWLAATGVAEALATFGASLAVLRWAGVDWAPALTVAAILMSTSPAVVVRVVSESGARGQVSERLLVLTALNSTLAVFGAKAMTGWMHFEGGHAVSAALAASAWAVGGAIPLGWLLAKLLGWAIRRLDLAQDNGAILVLGLLLLAASAARWLGVSVLLAPLLAGLILKHADPRPLLVPRHFGSAGGVLVAGLFVVTGLSVTASQFVAAGWIAFAVVGARIAAKFAAAAVFARPAGLSQRQGMALGIALCPLSGVAFALTSDLALAAPEGWAGAGAIVVSAIAIMELAGPIALQWALRLAGETAPDRAAGNGRR